jgi:hypothetical protein
VGVDQTNTDLEDDEGISGKKILLLEIRSTPRSCLASRERTGRFF